VGAAVHAVAGRRRPVHPSCSQRPWFADETYVKVGGIWRYVYRAIDQHGQVTEVLLSVRRDAKARTPVRHRRAADAQRSPSKVVTDAAPIYPGVLDELILRPGTTSSNMRTTR
jgi:transposase-like protein